MKKVWVLEKFQTVEEMKQMLKDMIETFGNEQEMDEKQKSLYDSVIEKYKRQIEENPDGRWYGLEGKSIYRQFCDVAKDALRRNKDGKFRVVEGEIEDNAKYWIGYKFVKENEGVLRYLMATK